MSDDPLRDDPLHYAMRRYGMDHERYAWTMLGARKPVVWPQGKRLALWVNVSLQFFPLNPSKKPVSVPGNMTMPYPDLRHFSLRDYGNRVGIYRVLDALDRHRIAPSFAINARLAERHPALLREIAARGEIVGHSWSMDTAHAGGLDAETETQLVQRSLALLRARSGQPVRGWISPGKQQSAATPDLIRAHGIDWCGDWVNDELPYRFETAHGALWSLPLSTELEDRFVLLDNLHPAASWAEQVIDAATLLLDEARAHGGRLLTLSLHPWVIGQPHRIRYLEQVLAFLAAQPEVWSAPPSGIVDAFAAQQ